MANRKEDNGDLVSSLVFGKWKTLTAAILNLGFALGIPVSVSVMLLDLQSHFRVSLSHVSAVHATIIGLMFAGSIVPGYLVTRIGERLTLLTGCVLATSAFFLSIFATSIDFLIATTGVIGGVGFCFLQLPIIPVVTMVSSTYKTSMISLCFITAAVMGVVNRYVLVYIMDAYSWRWAYSYLASLTLNSALLSMVMTSRIRRKSRGLDRFISFPTPDTVFVLDGDSLDGSGGTGTDVTGGLEGMRTERVDVIKGLRGEKEDEEGEDVIEETRCMTTLRSTSSAKAALSPPSPPLPPLSSPSRRKNADLACDLYCNGEKLQSLPTHAAETATNNNIKTRKATSSSSLSSLSSSSSSSPRPDQAASVTSERPPGKCGFLCDVTFLVHTLHVVVTVSCLYSFALIQMDFARTSGGQGLGGGGQERGVVYLNTVFVSSILGRAGVGLTGLSPTTDSLMVNVLVSVPGCVAFLLLTFLKQQVLVIAMLCLVGISLGGLVTVYPKCVLDMRSIDHTSYPIALGLTFTLEGVMDLIIPIAIGYSVDVTGSYQLILSLIGCLTVTTTTLLAIVFLVTRRRNRSVLRTDPKHHQDTSL